MFNFQFSYFALPNLFAGIYVLFFGCFIFFKTKEKNITNVTFFFLCMSICIWLFNYCLSYLSPNEQQALFWARNSYFGITFIAIFVHHFFISFFNRNEVDKFWVRFSYIAGIILLIFSRSQLFFSHAYKYFWGYYPKGSTLLYSIYLVFFFGYFFRTIFVSYKEFCKVDKKDIIRYNNSKLMLIGVCVAHTGGADFIAKYGIEFYPIGYFFILIWVTIVGYAIVKYRFFDIETVIHKTLLWLFTSALVVIPFAGITYLLYPLFKTASYSEIVALSLGLSVLTLIYYQAIQPKIDHLFQRKKYDYQNLLELYLKKVSTLNSLSVLIQETKTIFSNTFYPKNLEILIFKQGKLSLPHADKTQNISLEINKDFENFLLNISEPIELDLLDTDQKYLPYKTTISRIFSLSDSVILFPVIHNNLLGLICLGKKVTLKKYSNLDIKFTQDLAMEFSIALANSLMFTLVEEQNTSLIKLDKLKDDFLANTSHELRTPLNGIIGITESIIDGAVGAISNKLRDNLLLVTSSGRRLASLINDILDFSKIKNNELSLQRKLVGLREMTNIVMLLSKPLLAGKSITLVNNIGTTIPSVFADENRLQQILHNLIGNAIKFTQDGSVTIGAAVISPSLADHSSEGFLQISITDTGIGIHADKFDAVFASFEQVDASNSRQYGGTGLGLSITKQLVELHGGKIWLESK